MKSIFLAGLAATVSLAPLVPAQGIARVIPASATKVDGNGNSVFPYVYDKHRVQHLIDGNSFCKNSAVLFGFAYRIDGAQTRATPGLTIANSTVTIGHSPSSAGTMSTTFANNRTGPQTVVFKGTYNLPAQPPPNGLGTFNVIYKINSPWAYSRKTGNLLIEFVVPGQASRKQTYPLDAALSGAALSYIGTPGRFSNNGVAYLYVQNMTTLKPGGSIDLQTRYLPGAYPTVHVYGFSNSRYGPLRLPFDLTPIGAPGNHLYCSLDLMILATVAQLGSRWAATSKLPVPNDPSLRGATIFASNICVDKAANKLGLVFGRSLGISLEGAPTPMNLLYQQNSTSATGNLFSRSKTGGPVIELKGAYN